MSKNSWHILLIVAIVVTFAWLAKEAIERRGSPAKSKPSKEERDAELAEHIADLMNDPESSKKKPEVGDTRLMYKFGEHLGCDAFTVSVLKSDHDARSILITGCHPGDIGQRETISEKATRSLFEIRSGPLKGRYLVVDASQWFVATAPFACAQFADLRENACH